MNRSSVNIDQFDSACFSEKQNRETVGPCYPNFDEDIFLRTCKKETTDPISGTVTGTIPKWLNGTLLRNGPGQMEVGESRYSHLFDSSALLHRFNIEDGEVSYQCKFLQSETFKANKSANRIVATELGTAVVPDPCHSIFDRVSVLFNPGKLSDNSVVSIHPIGDKFYALTDGLVIHQIDPQNLDTLDRVDLCQTLGVVNHTSHPHIIEDGRVYNLGLTLTKLGPQYCVVELPNEEDSIEKGKIVATVPVQRKLNPSYMHSFGMTENYFIVIEQPISISVVGVVKSAIFNRPFLSAFEWFPGEKTQFHLTSRTTGVREFKFVADPFTYFHIINQYEDDGHVIVDLMTYNDPAVINSLYVKSMENLQNNENYADVFRAKALRFVLPIHALESKTTPDLNDNLVNLDRSQARAFYRVDGNIICYPETLTEHGCDMPAIFYRKHSGKKYQYFYAMNTDLDSIHPLRLIKCDVVNKTTICWSEDNCFASEPVFVPHPDQKEEDDGVVISIIIWGRDQANKVGLLVLCAKSFQELGRCVFNTAAPSPHTFHGWFQPRPTQM